MLAETSTGLVVQIRQAIAEDEPYAMSCAVRTVLSAPSYKGLTAKELRSVERDLRARWRDPSRDHVVACLPEDPTFIMGFGLGLKAVPVIDYIHVRGSFTGQGLATLLAETLGATRKSPAFVEFDTPDLSRKETQGALPTGILNTGRWPHLTLRASR